MIREELHLAKKRSKGLHKLLTRMVMDSFVSCLHNARFLGLSLNLLLHVTRVLCASIIAPFDLSRFQIPISCDHKCQY